MNLALKCLAAVACIAVILASGVIVLRQLDPPASSGKELVVKKPGSDKDSRDANLDKSPDPKDSGASLKPKTKPVAKVFRKKIMVPKDHPLQPSYVPVNRPAALKMLRQAGKTYTSRLVGKLDGQASKKDWGFRGKVYFQYLFTVESKAKILSNDGLHIVEERTFSTVQESLIPSQYELRMELPPFLTAVIGLLGDALGTYGKIGAAVVSLANQRDIPLKREWVEQAKKLGILCGTVDQELHLFTQQNGNYLLQGKTVRIVFEDGRGVTEITPINCELTEREYDLIVRNNFLHADYYLMPRELAVGQEWTVPAHVFGGFFDPRLGGKPEGSVTARRLADDTRDSTKIVKRVRLTDGEITFRETTGEHAITGLLTDLHGAGVRPDAQGIFTKLELKGRVRYNKLSQDHLLFQAETSALSEFLVRYECTME